MKEQLENYAHKRLNILTGEWVLVSPHRSKRPWQGQTDEVSVREREQYDETCYLCPGNQRASSENNPNYTDTFVFNNDYAALGDNSQKFEFTEGLLQVKSESGICKVVCFSPDHSKSLAEMSIDEVERVVSVWQSEYEQLGKLDHINYIQIFENKGAIMGCSNPHPHGQIWAESSIPNEVLKKNYQQEIYFKENNSGLLADYINQEIKLNERILFENKHFLVIVPFWATWPFETMIVPKEKQSDISLMTTTQKNAFAEAIKKLTVGYDKLFNCSFPYSSGIHQAPTNENKKEHWHWHMSFYPPLLRSATVKKFMVGYEMFAMPQRDITAEKAAEILLSKINL